MTNPRDLISAATPLPWRIDRVPDGHTYGCVVAECAGSFVWANGNANDIGDEEVAALIGARDAALIVYSVNNLPALLDVADALERLMTMFDGNIVGNALVMHASDCMTEAEGLIDGTISCTCGADEPLLNAETALARLRENQP